jgi:hypothetical protein
MSGEMNFHASGNKLFTTALASPGQYRSSTLGFHTSAKPELTFPGPF